MNVKMALLRMQFMAGFLSGRRSRPRGPGLHITYPVVDSVAGHSDNMCGVCHRLWQMDGRDWDGFAEHTFVFMRRVRCCAPTTHISLRAMYLESLLSAVSVGASTSKERK